MALRNCLRSSLQYHSRKQPLFEALLNSSCKINQNGMGGMDSWSIPPATLQQYRFVSSHISGSVEDYEKVVLYRAKWMQPLRLMVRLKIFQLGGLAALTLPLAEYANEGSLSVGTLAAVTAVVGGAGAASAALWYYSRRYVGEMALVGPDLRLVQLSVVDFWGNREDNKYDLRDVVPPLKGMSNSDLAKAANQVLIPLDVVGARQFFLSIRYGRLLQKDMLFALLHGTMDLNNVRSLLASQQALQPITTLKAKPLPGAGKEERSPMHQKV